MFGKRFRREVLSEIQELRDCVKQLEENVTTKLEGRIKPLKERAPRQPLHSKIELVGDFDILEAEGVDISESGICFELKTPLYFDMRFVCDEDGTCVEKCARLIWVKQEGKGRSRLGFSFVEKEPEASDT